MPLYYFDVTDSRGFHRDEFGVECADPQAARDQAVSLLPDIAREELPDGDQHAIRVRMRDDTGRVVYDATLSLNARWIASDEV